MKDEAKAFPGHPIHSFLAKFFMNERLISFATAHSSQKVALSSIRGFGAAIH
jgi:hypothetical protein